jgi:DNA recombination protein RmuC
MPYAGRVTVDILLGIILVLVALLIGVAVAAWRATRAQLAGAEAARNEQRIRELVETATAKALNDANAALFEQNAKQFVEQRAETMKSVEIVTKPLSDGIAKLQQSVQEFDKAREAGAETLKATLEAMARTDETLRQTVERSTTETAKLATALRDNRVRGRWGEIGLRNVLDKVGLTAYCDFVEQAGNEDGKRPDVTIRLPGDREVTVDSKVPFEAYMNAIEATDPAEQHRYLLENAQALRAKVRDLAAKGYHKTPKSIGVTILYVQIESVVAAALTVDPALVEDALDLGIVISSPATLLAYLRAFAREWSLYKQSLNAEAIVEQAHEMLDRLVTFAGRFAEVGAKLDGAVDAWNASVGSFDGRLVVTAKQIAELSGTSFAMPKAPRIVETTVRELKKVDQLQSAAATALPGIARGA